MRRQPQIIRCFVALCFGSAATLAAFEWRSPFPGPIVTPAAMPDLSSAPIVLEGKAPAQKWPWQGSQQDWATRPLWAFFQRKAQSQPASTQLILSLQARSLEVRIPGQPSVSYPVAIGQDDWQTPIGEFKILNKLENPAWQHPITHEEIPPGPENPLGTRWIGFWSDGQAQIGFHGTNQEELIGEAVSHGCVRLRNQDIESLYSVVEVGQTVKVVP